MWQGKFFKTKLKYTHYHATYHFINSEIILHKSFLVCYALYNAKPEIKIQQLKMLILVMSTVSFKYQILSMKRYIMIAMTFTFVPYIGGNF